MEYPVLSYLLVLKSEQTGVLINVSLDSNETEVVLGPQNRLEDNQKYVYTVTAINSIGNTLSEVDGKNLCEWKYYTISCASTHTWDECVLVIQLHLMYKPSVQQLWGSLLLIFSAGLSMGQMLWGARLYLSVTTQV